MMPRKLCNYANASSETPKKGALYQRGQYYIIENNDRKGDRRRYSVFINDSMIGMGGSLARMKRFVNQMYGSFPFETDVSESIEKKVKTFSRLAQRTLRSEMKPSRVKAVSVPATKSKATPKKNPGAKKTKPLVSESLKPKPKPNKLTATRWKKFKTDSERARMKADESELLKINRELSEYPSTGVPKIGRLLTENRQAIEFINQQGRLF